jgi:hypothetical protein
MRRARSRAWASPAKVRGLPRKRLRVNWSSSSSRARAPGGVSAQSARPPARADSTWAPKRRRMLSSKSGSLMNQALRGLSPCPSIEPNQKSNTSRWSATVAAGALVQVVGPAGDDEALHIPAGLPQIAVDAARRWRHRAGGAAPSGWMAIPGRRHRPAPGRCGSSVSTATGPASGSGSSATSRSLKGVAGVTSCNAPMRSGKGAPAAGPAWQRCGQHQGGLQARQAGHAAPHSADPSANGPQRAEHVQRRGAANAPRAARWSGWRC